MILYKNVLNLRLLINYKLIFVNAGLGYYSFWRYLQGHLPTFIEVKNMYLHRDTCTQSYPRLALPNINLYKNGVTEHAFSACQNVTNIL